MCTRVNKRADVPERMYVPGTRAVMIEFCLQFHAFVRRSKAIGCLVANWLMDVEGTCKECEATKRPSKGRRRDLTKNKFPYQLPYQECSQKSKELAPICQSLSIADDGRTQRRCELGWVGLGNQCERLAASARTLQQHMPASSAGAHTAAPSASLSQKLLSTGL